MSQIKIAILYTGEVRTIEKVIDYFVKNVLVNDNIHVFATLQSGDKDNTLVLIKNKMGQNLKSVNWFEKDDLNWNLLQNDLLSTMNIAPNWSYYLKNIGSMIEYYQMYLSYNQLIKFENETGIKYDFILRIRPDIVVTQKMNFDYLNMSENEIFQKLNIISKNTGDPFINSKKNIILFMN